MKQLRSTTRLLALILFLTSCATILPGNDPVVVNAERVTKVALTSVLTFTRVERENEAELRRINPTIHEYAQKLRREAQGHLRSARILTRSYKLNRTAQNKASLVTALAVLQTMIDQTNFYLTQANNSTP